MEKLKEAETVAAQRLRKTFKYPSESDDEDTVEAGMDEQGTLPSPPCLIPALLTGIHRPRSPTPNPQHTRHVHDAHIYALPSRATVAPHAPLHPAALRPIDPPDQSSRYREPASNSVYLILPATTADADGANRWCGRHALNTPTTIEREGAG